MATTENEVRTVFTVDDQASGPLKQISKAATTTAASTTKAQKATGGGGGDSNDVYKAMREEARARRMRTRGLKLEEQQGDILESAVSQLSGAVGGNSGIFGKMASITEGLGFQMSAFGGTLGSLGSKLVSFGGTAGAVAGSFAAGYAVGEMLVSGMEKLNNELGLWETDVQKNRKQNEEYAKSLGYRNAAEYQAANKTFGAMQAEAQFQEKIEAQTKFLAAMPTDKFGPAMENWLNELESSARATGVPADQLQKAADALRSAAEKSVGTWLNEAQSHAKLDKQTKDAAKVLAMYVPSVNKTIEEQERYNAETAKLVQAMVRSGQITVAEGEAKANQLQQQAEAYGNYGNIINGYRDEADLQVRMQKQAEEQVKNMKRLPLHATAAQLFALNHAIAEMTAKGATRLGLTPEQTKEYLGVVKEAAMKKTQHVTNFNNNKFDIKQAFAEGFDPDRIAVAFANDLATLGERRQQAASGLVPLGVR